MEKIRILFLDSKLVCGGAEQALYDLLKLLDPEEFEITVLALYQGGEWTEKFENAGIRVISPWSCQKETRNPLRKLHNKFLGLGIIRALENQGKNLIPRCTGEKFDIVVSYSLYDKFYAGFAPGARSVLYVHGDLRTNPEYAGCMEAARELLPRYDRIICVSRQATESFREVTGISRNVVCCLNPIDSGRVRKMAGPPGSSRGPTVCAVGRLGPEKGFDRLIRIHSQLVQEGLPHRLIIVGDGPERKNLEDRIRRLGAQDSVTLTGYTENPYPYMRSSRFLVISSYTEGLPVVAMEALCLGIPVVSAVPSVGELFGGENCGLITENDDESLKKALKDMLGNEDFYRERKLGAERKRSFFEGERMVRQVREELLATLQ